MQDWDQVGHCNVCKPMTKWDTLMCDPRIYGLLLLALTFTIAVGSYQCTCNTGYIHEYTDDVTSHCIDLNECKDSGSKD